MRRRVIFLLLGMAAAAVFLAAHSIRESEKDADTAQISGNQKAGPEEELVIWGEVASIEGNTVILTVNSPGEPGEGMEEPPAAPGQDMEQPPDAPQNGTGQPPAPPQTDGEQPPDVPEGGPDHSSAAEERKITVTDSTKNGTLSDLTKGSHVEVALEADGITAASIRILTDRPQNGSTGAENIKLSGKKTIAGKKVTSSDRSYSSSKDDENAVLVTNKGSLHMAGAVLSKSGDTSSEESSSFYGQNAVLAVTSGSTAELTNVEITSEGEGANAIFATGEKTSVLVDTAKIHTKGDSSRGLDATYGGTITASNVDISTVGAHCAALATDRGEGTIEVTGANLSTKGEGSPCIYSTGQITVRDASGNASHAQTLVVEGKNSVDLTDCRLKGAGDNGLMLYQSTSGDAQAGTATLSAAASRLTTKSKGPMIYVTNTDAQVTLTDTRLKFPGDTLIRVSGNETNNWGIPGQNGGNLSLTGVHQKLKGKVSCDAISTVRLILTEGSAFTGSLDPEHTGRTTSVQLDDSSAWNVTEDSYITFLENALTDCSNIRSNGHNIYYDSTHPDNEWLKGQQLALPGGGQLIPQS